MEIVLNFSTKDFAIDELSLSSNLPSSTFAPTNDFTTLQNNLTQNCLHSSYDNSDNGQNFDYLNELIKQKFNDATVIISVVVLVLINLVVIVGNVLVILSVFTSSKLRTVTNFFIVSLAVADFLVGIAVLPYSLTLEILDTWIFGEIWCQGWLVIDVWMCTASILNLCAISVDRYLAVTQPVRYRSLMTAKRAKYIIAAVWILSFIICFPMLVVRTREMASTEQQNITTLSNRVQTTTGSGGSGSSFKYKMSSVWLESHSLLDSGTQHAIPPSPHLIAGDRQSTDSSSTPLATSSLARSSNVPEVDPLYAAGTDSNSPFHLLTPLPKTHHNQTINTRSCIPKPVQCALFLNKSYVIYSAFGSFYIPMFVMIFFYWRIYLVAIRTSRALKRGYKTTKSSSDGSNEERLTLRIHRGNDDNPASDKCSLEVPAGGSRYVSSKKKSSAEEGAIKTRIPVTVYKTSRASTKSTLAPSNLSIPTSVKCGVKPNIIPPGDIVELNGKNRHHSSSCHSTLSLPSSSPSCSREGSARSNKVVMAARLSKRTSKYQAKRFHAETKAAKTVGIIVGGFIVCWLPFFTVYLMRAFCEDCISDLLFAIFFWLGYCNSMINPCIYGLFSRDFRRAFKNIICRCKFSEETSVSSLIRQIHMPTFFEEDMAEEIGKHESQEY